eukprot:TRINITY_DN56378_c0_g1_i1.p1 TRINITY_DN56378_c0_g1~~TRINITY_DN56378_c0_g1_i1.p1  ORF type:complete len:182 (+),score=11.48 TRINITY_DN56378_c0_g1_i1:34-579(+)
MVVGCLARWMPRIYAPLKARNGGRRALSANSTPRTKMELSVRDDDPVQEMISSASPFFAAGTHRSNQCKDSLRTPGPGAYRTISTFPLSKHDDHHSHCTYRRSPRAPLADRARQFGRVSDIANPYLVVPPVVNIFQAQVNGEAPKRTSAPRNTVNTLPPCNLGKILPGHGGTIPKGHGMPF